MENNITSTPVINTTRVKLVDKDGRAYVKHFIHEDGRIVTIAVIAGQATTDYVGVSVGFSICMKGDTFKEEHGVKAAVGRARAHKMVQNRFLISLYKEEFELLGKEKCFDAILDNANRKLKQTKLAEIDSRKAKK